MTPAVGTTPLGRSARAVCGPHSPAGDLCARRMRVRGPRGDGREQPPAPCRARPGVRTSPPTMRVASRNSGVQTRLVRTVSPTFIPRSFTEAWAEDKLPPRPRPRVSSAKDDMSPLSYPRHRGPQGRGAPRGLATLAGSRCCVEGWVPAQSGGGLWLLLLRRVDTHLLKII